MDLSDHHWAVFLIQSGISSENEKGIREMPSINKAKNDNRNITLDRFY